MLVYKLDDHSISFARQASDSDENPEVLGSVRKLHDLEFLISSELRQNCTPEELGEIEAWLRKIAAFDADTRDLAQRVTARLLPERLAEAAIWFRTAEGPKAHWLALRIASAMHVLESALGIHGTAQRPVPPVPRPKGCIDRVLPQRITGWLSISGAPEPAQVRIRIPGREDLSIVADQPRPDVARHGFHPTGNCGFVVKLDATEALKLGTEIRAYAEPSGIELSNSPAVCVADK